VTDPLQVSVNDVVIMEIGKPVHDSEHLMGMKFSILAVVNIVDAYDGYTRYPGVLAEIL